MDKYDLLPQAADAPTDKTDKQQEPKPLSTTLFELAFDVAKEISKQRECTDKPAETFTKEQLQDRSNRAFDLITRNQDFGYGLKRDRLMSIFREAADLGPQAVRQLTDALNQRLAARGLQISGEYNVNTKTVDVADHSHSRFLVQPRLVRFSNASADFTLRNTVTKETEDSQQVIGREISREDVIQDPKKFKLPGLYLHRPTEK
jgi:hypothetical protein